MNKGYLNLVLHAHLPYIRHPEHEYFLEENWFYEAVTESYIPLLDVLATLLNDNVDFNLTFSLSPALVEMFNDDLLRGRCSRHINNLIELSEKEISRTRGNQSFEPLARMYNSRFRRIKSLYEDSYKKDLTSAFRKLQDTGKVELITSAATHAYLPLFSLQPNSVRAQINVAVASHTKNFGRAPSGLWLPECGYFPHLDSVLKKASIKFFFMETHGIMNGAPEPKNGVYKPVACPSGVVAFGRDAESSKQVWSSVEGYPGDFFYRDFYRDIGFDLPMDYIRPYMHSDGTRTYTGIKYHRITDKNTDNKMPYIRETALERAEEHAEDFIFTRNQHVEFMAFTSKIVPIITAPYDAELFGHWWFEGPDWLNSMLRKAVNKHNFFRTITASRYLNENSGFQRITPLMSSWGNKGFNDVWLNNSNCWIYRHLHKASERMIELSNAFPMAEGLLKRMLAQAAREILLAQHSDWAFIIKSGAAPEYAARRVTEHLERFNYLFEAVKSRSVDETLLSEIEEKDRIFQDIDYRVYSDQESSLSKG